MGVSVCGCRCVGVVTVIYLFIASFLCPCLLVATFNISGTYFALSFCGLSPLS